MCSHLIPNGKRCLLGRTEEKLQKAILTTKLRVERQIAAAKQHEKNCFDLRLKGNAEEKRHKLNELKKTKVSRWFKCYKRCNCAPLGVNEEGGGTGTLAADWLQSIVNQTVRELGDPLPSVIVSQASRGLDQAGSSIFDNVRAATYIEDNLNKFADSAATDYSNVIDNIIMPSLQQHLNFNSETMRELRPNAFG